MIDFIQRNKGLFFVLLSAGVLMRFFMLWLVDYNIDAGDAANYFLTASNTLSRKFKYKK